MKVAILGNMNNNHFSTMRYLRDLGVDTYLFLYVNEQKHFMPEMDTWEIKNWEKYIIQTELINGNYRNFLRFYKNIRYVRKIFSDYDFIIANGMGPAYFFISNIKLDIFKPYCFQGEFLTKEVKFKKKRHLLQFNFLKYFQWQGLKYNTNLVITYDISDKNLYYFNKIGSKVKKLSVPMVYNREKIDISKINLSKQMNEILKQMSKTEHVLFHHVRHLWINQPFGDKKNNILFEGFAKYIKLSNKKSIRIYTLEYGKDVEATKELIKKLEIENYVTWLPMLMRKEIMLLIEKSSIGGSAFNKFLWGGAGWEFMSKGIPFLHYFDTTPEEFEKIHNTPFPDFINVSNPDQIAKKLIDFEKNPEKYKKMGENLKDWFDKYNGISLAKEYKKLIDAKIK